MTHMEWHSVDEFTDEQISLVVRALMAKQDKETETPARGREKDTTEKSKVKKLSKGEKQYAN